MSPKRFSGRRAEVDVEELKKRLPSAKQIAADLYGVEWRGNNARCPRAANHAHGDRNPSFVFLDKDNRLRCFGPGCFGDRAVDAIDFVQQMEGCNFEHAIDLLAKKYSLPSAAATSQAPARSKPDPATGPSFDRDGWRRVASYDMGDGIRKVRLEHATRLQPGKNRPQKRFLWEHRAPDGTWKPGRGDRPHQAYVNQPFRDLDQVEWALGVESERSADTLGRLNLPAFSFKELTAQNAATFAEMHLCLLPDKDLAGAKNVNRAIDLLRPHRCRIDIIDPPADWQEAGDIHDAVTEYGWDADQVRALAATGRSVEVNRAAPTGSASCSSESTKNGANLKSEHPPPPPRVISLSELSKMQLPTASYLIESVITKPGAWCLIGAQKAGKTVFAVQMALSYHVGEAFLENYRMLESGSALMIEQDDPNGLASLREITERSTIRKDPQKFFTVENASFVLGEGFIEWLEREIRSRGIGLVVLDSYTAMRASHQRGSDIVKVEATDFGLLDRLAKRTGCVIIILHHDSKTAASLDWTQRGAGTYAIGMATEGQIYISRFGELPGTAPERLVQVRGRHTKGLELVIRFREETLSYDFVLDGGAAPLFPILLHLKKAFGVQAFGPKALSQDLGMARSSAHRYLGRLLAAGAIKRCGFGDYRLSLDAELG